MLNVSSLFDGMSCGQIALERSNILVGRFHAAEIDKPAMSITKKNFPSTVFLGDVTRWREWDIDWASIGLLMGGSPCQGFSFAGKQLAFDDPRSVLFFVFVDILNHIKSVNPNVKFLLENVRMKREFLDVITEHLGVEPVFINSALVSAQNRRRYYWANWDFGQPRDRGVVMRDILIRNADNTTLMSDRFVTRQGDHRCLVNEPKDKASSLSAMEYVKNGRQGDYMRCDDDGVIDDVFFYGERSIGYMNQGNEKWQEKGSCRADRYTQTPDTEKAFTLTANFHKGVPYNYFHDTSFIPARYRKLTPVECERLQTVPDNYTEGVSNTQRYKMLGNGWSVDTIVHIFHTLLVPRLMPGIPK